MSEDNKTNLHNPNDDALELERVLEVSPAGNNAVLDNDESSLFELEKSDVYYENLDENNLAQVEAELEEETEKSIKRKKDKEKARKKDALAFKSAREKHERDVEAENARRLQSEQEIFEKNQNKINYDNNTKPGTMDFATERNAKLEIYDSFENNVTGFSEGHQTSVLAPLPVPSDNVPLIAEDEYNSLRENYENSRRLFKSGGDNVSESVITQYKEDYERFFAVQRKIESGELEISYAPVLTPPSPVEKVSQAYESDSLYRRDNTSAPHTSPMESKAQNRVRSIEPKTEYFQPSVNRTPSSNGRDYYQPSAYDTATRLRRSNLNAFEQNMARYANAVYSQTRDIPASGSVTFDVSTPAPVVHNIAQARYDSLKKKHSDFNNELGSYEGKKVPQSVLNKTEQINKLYSSVQNKVENGSLKLVSDGDSVPKNVSRGGNGPKEPTAASALGTQAFFDRSRDNFSPSGKRVGDRHIKPVGTPFQGSPVNKYDKLKIYRSLELGSPFGTATRRSLRAIGGVAIASARSEQSGTVNMALSGQDRAREALWAAKTLKDTPRQIRQAYYMASNVKNIAQNVGRFAQGKDMLGPKERKPLTLRQINNQLTRNPFTSSEKPKIQQKFGSNSSLSASKVKNKIVVNTANNKNLKADIKSLQAKGAALTVAERKQLKSLLDQKRSADEKLRKLHGLKKAQVDATIRNRAADRTSKKSAEKTIKLADKQKLRLSKKDKAVLSRLQDRKDLLEKRKKLLDAREARKRLISSLGGVLGNAARESEESTVQGILGASRVLQNRYVRSILKVSIKAALMPVVGAKKVVGLGARKIDKKLGISRAVNETVKKAEEQVLRKTLNSRAYKELHGGIYNRVKRKVGSHTPDRIKTRFNQSKKAFNQVNAKSKAVLKKYDVLKERLKKSKLGKFVGSIGKGAKKVANVLGIAKKFLIKVGLTCGGVVLVVALLGAFVTSIGGAASSLFFGEDSNDGRIDLTKYVNILNDKEQSFLSQIDTIASDPADKYENITVNYQSGTLVNNFKEILSMTAVYFNQDFSDSDAVKTYIHQLYDDSHYYTTIESEPYACSGCEDRSYKCTDALDKYVTNNRKRLHNKYAERGGCIGEAYSCEGCVENTRTYTCDDADCAVKYHNDGDRMNSPNGCVNYKAVSVGRRTYYYCLGHTYCIGHTQVYYTCPGNHMKYHCDGHTETICRGEHVDLDINVMVLGFDEMFYADSTVNASITGVDTSTGNVTKGAEIGTFTVTYYCTERYPHICNAGPPYKTASGTEVTPGRTIAVDRSVIPLGTHVIINGHEYVAEDTGGAIKGNRIDIAVATHASALQNGKKTYKVYYAKALDDSSGDAVQKTRNLSIPYLDYAKEAADKNISQTFVLQAYGQAKEPVVGWSYNRVNYDDVNSFAAKLQKFDKDNEDKPFTNAELNTFEYVKMSKKKLVKLAKDRTGKDYSNLSVYNIIVDVLIPYDKENPDEYIVEPDSEAAKAYSFEGWTQENVDWVKNIYSFMDKENYAGLDKINQFSGDNVSYEGVVFEQGETKVVYYSQYDIRWKNLPYSNSTIGTSGCGPTSMAMIVSTLTNQTVDPIQMCNWSSSKGYYIKGQGTAWSFIPSAAAYWGLPCQDMGKGNAQAVVSALSQGKLVIMSTGPGSYYQGEGHFLVLRGVDEKGNILVADPASKSKSETSWTLNQITSGLKNWWIVG